MSILEIVSQKVFLVHVISGFVLGDLSKYTLKCLSIGTPRTIDIPCIPNGKLIFFMCPSIQAHYNGAVMCPDFGTPKNN